MATKYVRDTSAGKSISAWVILDKKNKRVADVQAFFGNNGRVLVNVWPTGGDLQHSTGQGVESALAGLVIDGHTLGDHCNRDGAQKLPKGSFVYPKDVKAKPGYYFANHSTVEAKTGHRIYSDYKDTDEYRAFDIPENMRKYGTCDNIKTSCFHEMKINAGDWQQGYPDCYKHAGLRYLAEMGYRVLQAI